MDLGIETYDSGVAREVRELTSENRLKPSVIGDNPFCLDTIITMRGILEDLLESQEADVNRLVSILPLLHPITRRLEVSAFDSTVPSLRHLWMTLQYAATLIEKGGSIYLIESVDSSGMQLIQDLDLMYFLDGEVVAVDLTIKHGMTEKMIGVWKGDSKSEKYKKLSLIQDCDRTEVVSVGLKNSFKLKAISYNIYRGSPRELDFQFVDETVDAFHSLSWAEADDCLHHFSQTVSKVIKTEHAGQIKKPGLYVSNSIAQTLTGKTIGCNDLQAALVYENFRMELDNHLGSHVEQAHGAAQYYSLDHYDRLVDVGTRWHVPIPEINRGSSERCPFLRLKHISAVRDLDPLSWALSKLTEVDEVSLSDYPDLHSMTSIFSGYVVKRVIKDGEKLNMIKLKHPDKTIGDLFSLLRSLNSADRTSHSLSELEALYERHKDQMLYPSSGSQMMEDIDSLIDHVMVDSPVAGKTRRIMRDALDSIRQTKIGTLLAIPTEIVRALTTAPRLRQRLKGSAGSFKKVEITLGVQCLADRRAVVLFNIGPITFGSTGDVSYIIAGDLVKSEDPLMKSHFDTLTSPLSMSPSMLDWFSTSIYKAISWSTLQYEQCLVSYPKRRQELLREMIMPLGLSFLNSNTFSQVADLLRYIFINGVGYTTGVSALFDKMSWYSPKTHIEKLYVLRMLKMSDCLSVHKGLGMTDRLKVAGHTHLHEPGALSMTIKNSGWAVAMPDESTYYMSQQHTFNSFYNSRCLTMQRYSKIMSEALVVAKQLDAREEYLRTKSENRKHEGRFLVKGRKWSKEELMSDLKATDFADSSAASFSPCPMTNYLSILASLRKVRTNHHRTVLDTALKVSKLQDVHRMLSLSKIMNARGSVMDTDNFGICVSRTETVQTSQGERKRVITQNSKCYLTQLELLGRMTSGRLPSRTQPHDSGYQVDDKPSSSTTDLTSALTMPENMSSVLSWLTHNEASCISKMVHKDQLGVREIAVLNANSRVMCRFVEDCSRVARDNQFNSGDRTNLIENSDKDDIVLQAKRRSDLMRHKGFAVMYDSADCSTWGPSMMPHFLYQTLAARCTGRTRDVLRNCLSLFGNKVFKIPDSLYWYTKDPSREGNNKVMETVERLKNMREDMGIYDKQVIFLEESMHQGILGCTSSLMGSDGHNLSDLITSLAFSESGLTSTTFTTSDDYARILSWDMSVTGRFDMMKSNLALHNRIMSLMGIKRNQVKSTLSEMYFEFNSTFMTDMGEIRPDVKPRLSFIDYSSSPDSYDVSMKPVSSAVEYLRQEGSLVGSCWIQLLNTSMALVQNQTRLLYKQIGERIFHVPLELGGLAKIDPMLHSVGHLNLGLLSNYGGEEDIERSFTIMNDCSPFTASLSASDHSKPSLSRSGMLHLCSKASQSKRRIREFLMSVDPRIFARAYQNARIPSLLVALMACAQRERNVSVGEGSYMKLMVTQTPRNAMIYKVNSSFLSQLMGSDLVSRQICHDWAVKIGTSDTFEYPSHPSGINTAVVERDLKTYYQLIKSIHPEKVTLMPRISHKNVVKSSYSGPTFIEDKLKIFESQNLPLAFGGDLDVHPWQFLEMKMSYTQFLKRLSERRQVFRMCLRERDKSGKTLPELILCSNYVGGGRMSYSYDGGALPTKPADQKLVNLVPLLQAPIDKIGNLVVSIMADSLPELIRSKGISRLDITEFLNTIAGDSTYHINNDSVESQIVQCLNEGGYKNRLVVNPQKLSVGFKQNRYQGSTHVMSQSKNLIGLEGLAGREIILQGDGGEWHHYCWSTKSPVTFRESEGLDIYHNFEVHETEMLPVHIVARSGFLMVDAGNNFPIQVLSRNFYESSKIRLFSYHALSKNHNLIQRLRDLKSKVMPHTLMEAVVDGRILPEPKTPVEQNDNALDLGIFEGEENPDMSLEEFAKYMEDEFGLSDVDDSDESEEDDDSFLQDSDDEDEIIEVESEPVVSQSSIRQPEGLLVGLMNSNLYAYSDHELRRFRKNLNSGIRYGYELIVPCKLPKINFQDNDEMDAMSQLYSVINTLDTVDRLWLNDFIDVSLYNNPEIKHEVLFSDSDVQKLRSDSGVEEIDLQF